MFMLFSFLLGKMLFNYVVSFFIILVWWTEISQSIIQVQMKIQWLFPRSCF